MKKNIKILINLLKKSVFLKIRTFLFLLILFNLNYSAQLSNFESSLNSIKTILSSTPKLGFKAENKFFSLNSDISGVRELKPYIEYKETIRFGLGYCWLKRINGNNLRFNAITFFGEYLINLNDSWAAEIPVDFGFGKIRSNSNGYYQFFEPSFIIEYKGFNFFNIGFGTGLRLSSHNKMVYDKSLTVQTLILRLNLKFVEIYKHILQVTNT
tara:strand:+ start:578 stop:1213 length:636 start_codon:yes stop_codon:yes gene_type:complete